MISYEHSAQTTRAAFGNGNSGLWGALVASSTVAGTGLTGRHEAGRPAPAIRGMFDIDTAPALAIAD